MLKLTIKQNLEEKVSSINPTKRSFNRQNYWTKTEYYNLYYLYINLY